MRLLARCAAVAGLVLAGGLALPDGAAEAAACSGTSGVTVVIDYGSNSTTTCAPNSSTAMTALRTVAQVEYPVQYQGTVVCKINGVPSNQTCQRMPPASAYWAFFHARRGGSWTYSSVGAADYAPAPGTVIGFAFGAGGQPSTAPPAAVPAPKPSPKPSPKASPKPSPKPSPKSSASSSSTHPSSTPNAARPSTPPNGSAASSAPGSSTRPSSAAPSGGATSAAGTSAATAATGPGGEATTRDGGAATVAGASTADEGSPTTLFAGLGLVGLVGATAAYVALRRRADG